MAEPEKEFLDDIDEAEAEELAGEMEEMDDAAIELDTLRAEGQSMLVIDGNVAGLLQRADRATILEKGRVVWTGTAEELRHDTDLQHAHLSVG